MVRRKNHIFRTVVIIAVLVLCGAAAIVDIIRDSIAKAAITNPTYVNVITNDTAAGTVTATSTSDYTVSPSGTPSTSLRIDHNEDNINPQVTATANSGYTFDKWVSTRGWTTITPGANTGEMSYSITGWLDGESDNLMALFRPSSGVTGTIYYTNGRYDNNGNIINTRAYLNAVKDAQGNSYKAVDYVTAGQPPTGVSLTSYDGDQDFVGWSNGTDYVSVDTTFVPSGDAIPTGGNSVTYYPVFTTQKTAVVSVNDPSLGCLNYDTWNGCNNSGTTSSFRVVDYYLNGNDYIMDLGNYNDIFACAKNNARFVGWYIDGVQQSTSNDLSRWSSAWAQLSSSSMVKVLRIVAVFADDYEVTIEPNNSNYGTISLTNTQSQNYTVASGTNPGSLVATVSSSDSPLTTQDYLAVTPASGYGIESVSTTGGASATYVSTSNGVSYYQLTFSSQGTITVNFAPRYTVTAQTANSSYGQIKFVESPASQSYTASAYDTNSNTIAFDVSSANAITTTGYLEVVPAAGYQFVNFTNSNGNVNESATGTANRYLLNFSGAGTITANFAPITYNVTFQTNSSSKGQLKITNTYSNQTAVPDNTVADSIVITVDCSVYGSCSTLTNSLQTRPASGYAFDHFEYSTNNAAYNSAQSDPTNNKYKFDLSGADTVTAVFVSTIFVNYANGSINNQTITVIDPNTHQAKSSEDAHPNEVTGITFDTNSVPVGARFVRWVDANNVEKSTSTTYVPSGNDLNGNPTYHPVFEEIVVNYTNGTAGETSVSPKDGSGNVKTSEGGLSPTGVTINSADIPVGYTFVGWANENDVIVSNSMSFIPSGTSQIYSGVSYHPVFSQALVATFSTNDGNTGQLGYIGWGDKCSNGNSLVTTISFYEDNQGLIDLPYNEVKACPVGDNVFLGWSLDGGNTLVSNAITANKWEPWTQFNGHNLNITAVFAPGIPYTISVNIPEAGSIDAQGGNCADSTKKTNQSWTAYLVEDNGTKTLDTYVSDSSVFQACVDNNDYQFDYWQIDNAIHASTATTLDKTNSGWPNQAAYHSLRAMFGFPITYLPGVVDSDTTKTVSTVDPSNTSNTKSSELSSSITGVTYSSADLNNYSNAKFAGWEEVKDGCLTPNCPIISTSETFVPTGDQVYVGATYRPVFVTDSNNYTLVISADPDAGYISYWSGSQNQWVGRTDNGEFHVATVNGYINGGIKATPRNGYVFDHWEHNGNTICTINDTGCVEIVVNEVAYQGANGSKLPTLVAYFVPLDIDPLPFTGSFEIWLIIGGGIGLVAIPSIILIISERKEKKQSGNKGGEKGGNKMKKLVLIISVCAALTITSSCFAESGTISGSYIYDSEAINGVNVSLHKVANYDGSFRYVDEYLGHERDVGRMTNSELGEYGEELAQVEAPPISITQTVDGNYSFSGFEEGIYLVTFEDKIIGDYTYSALPIVLTIPDANFNYNITLETKLEKSCPECVEPEPEPPEKQTNTHDVIQLYIKLFIILIFIETLTLFVIIKERKREDSNESK